MTYGCEENCIYFELCQFFDGKYYSPCDCNFFKDRSRFVELPCKVGDTVWFILTDLDDISLKDYTVTAGRCAINNGDIVTEIGTSGFWYQAIYNDGRTKTFNPSNDDFCEWDEFGKTVFLTREEAEQALKEREENAN